MAIADMKVPARFSLTVLMDQDGPYWVARCAEFDILTSHTDPEQAWADIQTLCLAQVMYAVEMGVIHGLFRPIQPDLVCKMSQAVQDGTPIELSVTPTHHVIIQRRRAA